MTEFRTERARHLAQRSPAYAQAISRAAKALAAHPLTEHQRWIIRTALLPVINQPAAEKTN